MPSLTVRRMGTDSQNLRIKVSVPLGYNGAPTCNRLQVIPPVEHCNHSGLPSGNSWTCQQNNANNAYYVTIPSGQVNNNNKNNAYAVVRVAELEQEAEMLLLAESDCYRNKKHRKAAARYHYHLAQIYNLAERTLTNTYKPQESLCFVLTKPKYREVFAASYEDRIIHHYVAPFILHVTESVHTHNGNISHGNRPGLSAQTAAKQIQGYMRQMPDGYVITMDISGFFMNIARQMSFDNFARFCKQYTPIGYSEQQKEKLLSIIHLLLTNSPEKNCIIRSPQWLLDKVPPHKSLRSNNGKGIPIGNFYSQLIAGLLASIWGQILLVVPNVCVTQFVDDSAVVVRNRYMASIIRELSAWILSGISLTLHPTKFYCQPVRHGAYFCGRYIYKDRIYIGNRTVRACKGKIKQYIKDGVSLENAKSLTSSVNSYFGIMSPCATFNVQRHLSDIVLCSEYKKYLYFIKRKHQLVCKLKKEYTNVVMHRKELSKLYNQYKRKRYEYICNRRAGKRP